MGIRHATSVRLLAGLAAAVGVLAAAPGASAGGWAVTTLDVVPAVVAGEPSDVGFTIRQHGTTPVDVPDVALVLMVADGATSVFPAVADGPVGHYTATIVAPAGSYRFVVRQGWLGEQGLGVLAVGDEPASAVAAGFDLPDVVAPALGAAAVLVGVGAVADLVRRRRPAVAAEPTGAASAPRRGGAVAS